MIYVMCEYYKLTGDSRFLARIPEAIAYLESQALPESGIKRFSRPFSANGGNILVPRFVCPDTGKPQYVHRRSSNFFNGEYFVDQDMSNPYKKYPDEDFVHSGNEVYQLLRQSKKMNN